MIIVLDFSDSDKKIRIVFAAEDDRYYTDSLLKLDLNQYLWMSLRKYYDDVWFVSVNKRGDINVKCFENNVSVVKKQSSPSKWFIEQASRDRKQAFVVKKDSFKALFEQRSFWGETSFIDISKFQNIMVIVVVPTKISELKDLLFEDYPLIPFNIKNIKSLENKAMIVELSDRYRESCLFLQTFTEECVRNMLLYIMFGDKKKMDSLVLIEYMTVYLTQYMNNKAMQWKFDLSLFDSTRSRQFPLHNEIEEKLKDDTIWRKLEKYAKSLYDLDQHSAQGALKIYLEKYEISFKNSKNDDIIFMDPEIGSQQEYCLNADPYTWKIKTDTIPKSIRKYVFEYYDRLHCFIMTTGGQDFCSIRRDINSNSGYEKYFRCLICIEKFMKLLYEEDGEKISSEMKIINDYWITVNKLCDLPSLMYVWDTENYDNTYSVLSELDTNFCLGRNDDINVSIQKCQHFINHMPYDVWDE